MEITFTPGLSKSKNPEDETTLDKYRRKMKEKRKKRKEEKPPSKGVKDDFFDGGSESDEPGEAERPPQTPAEKQRYPDHLDKPDSSLGEPAVEAKHFDMKSVLKGEKKARLKGKHRRKLAKDDETQEDFVINASDDRFKVLHEDPSFAIDPSNPRYVNNVSTLCFYSCVCIS
jgi:hypothetical protein